MDHVKNKGYVRKAYHAGSWYSNNEEQLQNQLQSFLNDARTSSYTEGKEEAMPSASISSSTTPGLLHHQRRLLRAVIVPHAGYSYSGPTAAYAYAFVREELLLPTTTTTTPAIPVNDTVHTADRTSRCYTPIRHIIVLHPSHHVYLDGCAVSGATVLETPVGMLRVDDTLRMEIMTACNRNHKTRCTVMLKHDDEHEHSGEMQYPYLAKILSDCGRLDQISVLPIMCGALSTQQETNYGSALTAFLRDRHDILTVVSTDFCHWGKRFAYQPTPSSSPVSLTEKIAIHEFIEQMDRQGMDLIASQQPGAFAKYLQETSNTICGRHAVAVWLRAVASGNGGSMVSSQLDLSVQFVRYAQSSAVTNMNESSVSYAAAIATIPSCGDLS